MNFIEIDGSHGEGGGQSIRTALSLSALLQEPFRIANIRASRPNPGLSHQHLTGVRAVAQICNAKIKGDFLGSSALEFVPQRASGGKFSFDCGTAGSTALILQTILPVLFFAGSESTVSLRGGTENKWAPTGLDLRNCFCPLLSKLGLKASVKIEKFGFYPAGGGEIAASVSPAQKVSSISLLQRGKIVSIKGISLVSSRLPVSVAERQKTRALKQLSEMSLPKSKVDLLRVDSLSPGSELYLLAEFENTFAGFSALGEKGKPSEKVAGEALHELKKFLESNATVDLHLSDQLLLYLALAHGESSFVVQEVSSHFSTNAELIKKFLPDCKISWEKSGSDFVVTVQGVGYEKSMK